MDTAITSNAIADMEFETELFNKIGLTPSIYNGLAVA
jgi:hypothetical protein